MMALSGFFFSAMRIDRNYAVPALAVLLVSLFFLWAWQRLIFRFLSVVVDDHGVSTLYRGKLRTHIAWSDVKTVESGTFLSITSPVPRTGYTISGVGEKIYFDDGLTGFPELVAEIGKKVRLPD